MSDFELKHDAAANDEIRRVAHGRARHAIELLRDPNADPASAVHKARKEMKKLRATLRLVRPAIGEKSYERENARYRDAGRMLSEARDAHVRAETVQGLGGRFPDDPPPGGWAAISAAVADGHPTGGPDLERLRDRTATQIDKGDAEIARLSLDEEGFELFRPGLLRAYERGRAALRSAHDKPSDERLHDFRKRSKDLWYHLRLLRSAWPEPMKAMKDEAHELSDRLGDDHDLVVVSDFLSRDEARLTTEQRKHVGRLIEQVRRNLQREAFAYGDRLYAERPKPFVKRLEAYWRTELP